MKEAENMNFLFDKNHIDWEDDLEQNMLSILATFNRVRDIFRFRDYLYLNELYEYFGLGWNPERENECFLYKDGDLKLKTKPIGNTSNVRVYVYQTNNEN